MAKGASGVNYDMGEELGLEKGLLCQFIHSPVYNLFPRSAVFESNFIQVTKKGRWVDINNVPTVVTMGVTSTDPCLPLPNVLLMAKRRRPHRREDPKRPTLELTRMLPLRYLRLSVQSSRQRTLRFQMMTRSDFFLQLHPNHPSIVFALWTRLVNILEHGLSITTKDPAIRIRHSLVPSRPCSSSSSDEGMVKIISKEMSGVVSQISEKIEKEKEIQRRMSFQKEEEEMSALSNDLRMLFYDMPRPLVCAKCKGRLPRSHLRRSASEEAATDSEPNLLPWTDRHSYGLWQQETPGWLQPLCRLSSLAAAGGK
ncbi:Golgi-associated RAB2 interactor protein 1B-like [Anolis carolinensis]|uniref:Golgi-associated RAB2 interactor protein 1B-like n=1 Tax=Anolis carolinensis TaxID=28377 RepID=UPI002F2B1BB7